MTPEQEGQLLQDLGGMKANLANIDRRTQETHTMITGNGNPSMGLQYIVQSLVEVHKDCPIKTVEEKLNTLTSEASIAKLLVEAKKNIFTKTWEMMVTHPWKSIAVIISIMGALGFSASGIIDLLNKFNKLYQSIAP